MSTLVPLLPSISKTRLSILLDDHPSTRATSIQDLTMPMEHSQDDFPINPGILNGG